MSKVAIHHVVMGYPGAEQPTLDNLSLDIDDGQFFVLLGPSGCGKSTLLKLIAGLEEPDEGEIYLGERLINFVAPGERNVAMVFQNYALYPHMSVRKNILFPLKMRKTDRAQAEALLQDAARHLELETLLERNVADLSGGQRQRVAVARAIVRQPSVTLMDEPLSNLDARLRLQTREALLGLHREVQGTVIYVTHDQVEAMTMGDRIGVMNGGVLVQVGTPEDIYQRPVDRFVAGFVGSPPMNFIEGAVTRDGYADFRGGGLSVALRPELADAARRRLADQAAVTLGVRPEDIELAVRPDDAPPAADYWEITHVEMLGSDGVLVLRRVGTSHDPAAQFDGQDRLRVKVSRIRGYRVGQHVCPRLDPDGVFLFDETTRNIMCDPEPEPGPSAALAGPVER